MLRHHSAHQHVRRLMLLVLVVYYCVTSTGGIVVSLPTYHTCTSKHHEGFIYILGCLQSCTRPSAYTARACDKKKHSCYVKYLWALTLPRSEIFKLQFHRLGVSTDQPGATSGRFQALELQVSEDVQSEMLGPFFQSLDPFQSLRVFVKVEEDLGPFNQIGWCWLFSSCNDNFDQIHLSPF
jgi:hypothetical protein